MEVLRALGLLNPPTIGYLVSPFIIIHAIDYPRMAFAKMSNEL